MRPAGLALPPALAARLEVLHARLSAAWAGLSPRERLLLGILAVLAIVAALHVLVVGPLATARARLTAEVRMLESVSARLRTAPHASGVGPATLRTGSPADIAAAAAAAIGVAPRLTQAGAGVRVEFADAPFAAVVRWLADVERSSKLRAVEVTMARRPTTGFVSAEVLLTP